MGRSEDEKREREMRSVGLGGVATEAALKLRRETETVPGFGEALFDVFVRFGGKDGFIVRRQNKLCFRQVYYRCDGSDRESHRWAMKVARKSSGYPGALN